MWADFISVCKGCLVLNGSAFYLAYGLLVFLTSMGSFRTFEERVRSAPAGVEGRMPPLVGELSALERVKSSINMHLLDLVLKKLASFNLFRILVEKCAGAAVRAPSTMTRLSRVLPFVARQSVAASAAPDGARRSPGLAGGSVLPRIGLRSIRATSQRDFAAADRRLRCALIGLSERAATTERPDAHGNRYAHSGGEPRADRSGARKSDELSCS